MLNRRHEALESRSHLHAPKQLNSGFNLVRWILVITLGCSLGLLLVFVVLSTRTIPRPDENIRVVHRVNSSAAFQLSEEAIESEFRRIIEAQLTAFRQDDYPKAYNYAAAGIKAQVSLPAFERMVKSTYPAIAKSRAVQFGMMLDNGEQAIVNVSISGTSGRTRHFQYILQKERSGWKIFGVTEVKPTGMVV